MDKYEARARSLYMRKLGKPPSVRQIRQQMHLENEISLIEWLAMLVLLVLTVFTSYKVGALAVPYADQLLDVLGGHTPLADWVSTSFRFVTAILFMMLATPSLIYFKLLDGEMGPAKEDSRNAAWWSLRYITPRLPAVIVYASAAWLFLISSYGSGSIFERYLPVIVEIGLAQLVGNILAKSSANRTQVRREWKKHFDRYMDRLHNWKNDPEYLSLLYKVMYQDLKDHAAVKRMYAEENTKRFDLLEVELTPEKLLQELVAKGYNPREMNERQVTRLYPGKARIWRQAKKLL